MSCLRVAIFVKLLVRKRNKLPILVNGIRLLIFFFIIDVTERKRMPSCRVKSLYWKFCRRLCQFWAYASKRASLFGVRNQLWNPTIKRFVALSVLFFFNCHRKRRVVSMVRTVWHNNFRVNVPLRWWSVIELQLSTFIVTVFFPRFVMRERSYMTVQSIQLSVIKI